MSSYRQLFSLPTCRRKILWASMTLLIIICVCISHYASFRQQQAASKGVTEQYGQHITQLMAEQLAPKVFQQDAIALQLLARNLIETTHAQSVVIYGSGQRVLAEAHKAQAVAHTSRYEAAIVANDQHLGRLVVDIAPSRLSASSTNIGTLLVVIILLMAILWYSLKPQVKAAKVPAPVESEAVCVYLTLKIQHLDLLFEQMSYQRRQAHLAPLETALALLTCHYGAQHHSMSDDSITLVFPHLEYALGGACLLVGYLQKHPMMVVTTALVHNLTGDLPIAQALLPFRKSSNYVGEGCQLFVSTQLSDLARYLVQTVEQGQCVVPINGLKSPWQEQVQTQLQEALTA